MKAKSKNPSIEKKESTTAGNAGAENETAGKSGVDNPDAMSSEEMAAFEKIMGEIEGQEADKLNGGTEAQDRPSLTSAEKAQHKDAIETVESKEDTGAHVHDASEEKHALSEKDDDASLDEDQQKAFESIMAQIEGDSAGDGDAAPETSRGEQAEPELTDDDDFAAELEKVVNAADKAEGASSADPDDDASLDEDQQKVVENKTESIDAGDTGKMAPDSDQSGTADLVAEIASDDQDPTAGGQANGDADEQSQDISADINDILKEITSSDEEADLQETADDDIVAHEKKSTPPLQEAVPATSAFSVEDASAVSSEPEPRTDASPDRQGAGKTPPASQVKALQQTAPLREAPVSGRGRKKKTLVASFIVMLMIVIAGYFYGAPKRFVDSTAAVTVQATGAMVKNVETAPIVARQEPVIVADGPSDVSQLKTAADDLDRLRNEVIDKRTEIQELRAYYQAGIDAEKQGVVDAVHKTGHRKFTFNEAMAEPRISLGLAAIQRRDTYIRRLEVPVKDLLLDSEELLYLSRKAGLLSMMAVKTSDIDIDGFIRQADKISKTLRSALSQLNIDDVPATPLALETIWQDIGKQMPASPVTPKKNHSIADTDNAVVWKQICEGDYSGKHRLTALSPQAARCMARWKGKDLFLNAVTDLSAEAARGLAAWEGDWLGLNGLKELRPEAAVHLAQWKGKGLSLNGLSRLSPRVVAILSEWQGDQIELVNVKHMAHWENPNTRLFLSELLKRKQTGSRK